MTKDFMLLQGGVIFLPFLNELSYLITYRCQKNNLKYKYQNIRVRYHGNMMKYPKNVFHWKATDNILQH